MKLQVRPRGLNVLKLIFCVCMNELRQSVKIVTKNEGKGKNLNSVQEDDGIAESHSNAHAQLSESVSFQHATKAESRKILDYDDDSQEHDEAGEEIKHSYVMLGEDEKKVIEDFLSFVVELGHQKDLMIESSITPLGLVGLKLTN